MVSLRWRCLGLPRRGTFCLPGAIHVYGGDFFATPRSEWDPDTLAEKSLDVEHTKRVLAEADAAASNQA